VEAVNRLAKTTGSNPVPPHKVAMGYRHEKDKRGIADLTEQPSDLVRPGRVAECPVQLEAVLETSCPFGTRPDKDTTAIRRTRSLNDQTHLKQVAVKPATVASLGSVPSFADTQQKWEDKAPYGGPPAAETSQTQQNSLKEPSTRAALLLLGKAESTGLLSPHPAQLTWKLEGPEHAYEHFGPPFLLSTTRV